MVFTESFDHSKYARGFENLKVLMLTFLNFWKTQNVAESY